MPRPANNIQPRLLTLPDAAAYLGRSVFSLRTLIWSGELAVVQHPGGRKMWVDRLDLDRFIECNKVTRA